MTQPAVVIRSPAELEAAMAEFQRLGQAPADSAAADRRRVLDAAIQDYEQRCREELDKGRPRSGQEDDQ